MTADDIEFHSWPPSRYGGQHTNRTETGVLALHRPTGIAVACTSERSQLANRAATTERLRLLMKKHQCESCGRYMTLERSEVFDSTALVCPIGCGWRPL